MRKRIAIVAGVVLVLLVVADFGTRLVAQYAVSRALEGALDLEEQPSVSLGGFPFLPHLLSGRVPTASVSAGPLTTQGITFEAVELRLTDVRFATGTLLSGANHDIHVDDGTGTATIASASIPATVFGQDIAVRVRFEGGLVRVSSDQLPGSIHVRATIQEGALVLRPNDERIPLSGRYHLPEVVPGIRYTSIRVTGSRATLTFELHDVDLPCCD